MLETISRRIGWSILIFALAGLTALPIVYVGIALLTPTVDIWVHLWQTTLGEMFTNTLFLMIGVGVGTLVLGTLLAWLVVVYDFPGKGFFEWSLILPLAMPGYVMAFVALSLFNFTGPVQTTLRSLFGSNVWFPDIRSGFGVFIVMTLVLYPYVYLLARAAFIEQGATLVDAARSLGYNRVRAFFKVVLPMARPSIAVGVALAIMEAIADVGAVTTLGFPTLSSDVYRVWSGFFDEKAALELAAILLVFALLLLILEKKLRGRARYYQELGRSIRAEPVILSNWRRWGITALCSAVLVLSFGIPLARLGTWAIEQVRAGALQARYFEFTANTLGLAFITAFITIFIALLLAYGKRLNKGKAISSAVQVSAMGYAIPGAVVGIGIIAAILGGQSLLNSIYDFLSDNKAPLLSGSVTVLVYAYIVRFMAVAYRPTEASLEKITPNMDMAARNLGRSPLSTLRLIHFPMLKVGLLTGAVLVFVDVMKEQPATLLLRPLGKETLATRVWQLTNESLWEAASLPAITIVLAGMIPIIFLMRASSGVNRKTKDITVEEIALEGDI